MLDSTPDVGHGSGDSLLLHLAHPSVTRPHKLVGITSLPSHHHRASQRVFEVRSHQTTAEDVEVELYLGDAVYRFCDSSSGRHPLHPDGKNYTTILALDCAYHFDTRHTFLSQSFECLSAEGRIALADICFADDYAPSPFLRRMLGALGIMPTANVITMREYIRSLKDIGYADVSLTDISEYVFPGFMQFLGKRGLLWKVFASMFGMLVRQGARFVIVTGQKPGVPTPSLSSSP